MNTERQRKQDTVVFILGCILGLIIFLAVYGAGTLNVTDDSFFKNGYIEKDIVQHYRGWVLYRSSPWQFPIGVGAKIDYPRGTRVTFTDSVPVFAIFFKLLSPVLPDTFQYFGLWVALCFILQGGFGALLANVFCKNVINSILAAGVFILSPIMIERAFRHCALTSHFLIIACLYCYFKDRNCKSGKSFLPFYILNILAMMIQPYFLPFTFGIFFAYCIENSFRQKKSTPFIHLIFSIAATVAVAFAIGVFSNTGGSFKDIGYGTFNMNLNAFFNSWSKGFDNWSKVIKNRPYGPGNWRVEGFNYMGLGVLSGAFICFIIAIFHCKKHIFKYIRCFFKQYFGIVITAVALTIFAVGNVVNFGNLPLFTIHWPQKLLSLFGIFRANGRFGWLIVYLTIIFEIFVLSAVFKNKKNIAALAFMMILVVQLWDLQGVLKAKHDYFKDPSLYHPGQSVHAVATSSFWHDAREKYDNLVFIKENGSNLNIDLALEFAKRGDAVSAGFSARPNFNRQDRLLGDLQRKLKCGCFPDNVILAKDSLSPEYFEYIKSGNLFVYYVDGTFVIGVKKFTVAEINKYSAQGNFIVLNYPYIVAEKADETI
jgi:hypothetical protein